MRCWVGLAGVAFTIGTIWACTPPLDAFCPNGVAPFDGQTGVPVDAVIVVRTGEELPIDVPDLHDTVTLQQGGRDVPFHVEIDAEHGVITVIPDEPLKADAQYEVGAVDWYALGEVPHWWGPADYGRDYTITTFRTFSEPKLLSAALVDDWGTMVLAFSEPVDLASLDGRVWASTVSTSTGTGQTEPMTELVAVGLHEDNPHLVEVQAVDGATLDLLSEVRLDTGAMAENGTAMVFQAPTPVQHDDSRLPAYDGAPSCFSF